MDLAVTFYSYWNFQAKLIDFFNLIFAVLILHKFMDIQYRNKELSWLAFNERVLQESENKNLPLIERLKFLGIYSNNLDEFFRIRVATLKRIASIDAETNTEKSWAEIILKEIDNKVIEYQKRFENNYQNIKDELSKSGVIIVNEKNLNEKQQVFIQHYFHEKIRPLLFPRILTGKCSLSDIKDDSIYLVVSLIDSKGKDRQAIIEVPTAQISRFILFPKEENNTYIILLEDAIRFGMAEIFEVINFKPVEAYTIKLTRDAEFDINDDLSESYVKKISRGIEKRLEGHPVRFVYDADIPKKVLNTVTKRFHIKKSYTKIPGGRYHNFKDFINFPDIGKPELKIRKWKTIPHRFISPQKSVLSVIEKRDLMLHFPYQSFSHIIDLMREAAVDPSVTTVKMTVYRVAFNSSIMNSLINASRNGKNVIAIFELQARFNEESNIYWSNKLKEAGVKIIYGVSGMKVHAKLIFIQKQKKNRIISYSAVGTGNFNESTAGTFSDSMLLTSHKEICKEVEQVFIFFERNYKVGNYKNLLFAPLFFRKQLQRLIQHEIFSARNGQKAEIYFKVNNLVDNGIIEKLYEAHLAGVKVRLNVRGMFAMYPEIPEENISIPAIGIIDRYLEHSRVFYFYNGGNEKFYISSADLMSRNLDRRIEVACPIYDSELQNELRMMLEYQWKDNQKARILDNNLRNEFMLDSNPDFRSQKRFYEFLESINNEDKTI